MQTLMLQDGYAKQPSIRAFRPMTRAEVLSLTNGQHAWFIANDGKARQIKINGKVRTFKRDSNRVEVPVKYGLYEYHTFTAQDVSRLLVPL